MMLLFRSISGVAAAAWVTFSILGASYYTPEETTKSVGYMNSANALGRMTAMLAGGIVAERLGFSYAFLIGGAAGIIGFALSFGMRERKPVVCEDVKPQTTAARIGDLMVIIRDKQLICASVLCIGIQFINFATTFGFTPVAAVRLNASPFMVGMLGVVATTPGLLFSPLAGTVFPRKIGVGNTLCLGFALAGLSSALIPFCRDIVQLYAVQFMGSLGASTVFTLLMGLCIKFIANERRATAMGFFQAVYGLGMFLGPFVMGFIGFAFGLAASFVFTGFIGLLGIAGTIICVRKGYLRYGH
jgi:MFS family permease